MNLKDKTILLTGASRGIGLELSKQLAKEGANLILVARHFQEKLEGNHTYVEADLIADEGINKVKQAIHGKEIDALINVAGVGIYKSLEDLSIQDLGDSLDLNVTVPFKLVKLTFEKLSTSELGLVLNIGSGAGTMPFKNRSVYCASKYALRGLSLSLSEEFENRKPEFCLITLGSTLTTFGGKSIEAQKKKIEKGDAIFPVDYVATELIKIIKDPHRDPEIILYPSDHGFGVWKKP